MRLKTVLIIEDNPELRENIAELLQLEGYTVVMAKNGKEGYRVVKDCAPDIIVCDVLMEASDGPFFLKMMKADQTTSHLPIIFFSAGSAPPSVIKGIEQGADEYLSKPFTDIDLLTAVERQLNGRS